MITTLPLMSCGTGSVMGGFNVRLTTNTPMASTTTSTAHTVEQRGAITTAAGWVSYVVSAFDPALVDDVLTWMVSTVDFEQVDLVEVRVGESSDTKIQTLTHNSLSRLLLSRSHLTIVWLQTLVYHQLLRLLFLVLLAVL